MIKKLSETLTGRGYKTIPLVMTSQTIKASSRNFTDKLNYEKMEYSTCRERGTKKKSESPTGIEPMTFRTPVGRSNH